MSIWLFEDSAATEITPPRHHQGYLTGVVIKAPKLVSLAGCPIPDPLGSLTIQGASITDLTGLTGLCLTTTLWDCKQLTSLEGLQGAASVKSPRIPDLKLVGCSALVDYSAVAKCKYPPRLALNNQLYEPGIIIAAWWELNNKSVEELCELTLAGHKIWSSKVIHFVLDKKISENGGTL